MSEREPRRGRTPPAFADPVYVTRPLLPAAEAYKLAIEGIWERHRLTNKGPLHDALEARLQAYLRVPQVSLVSSGTMALMLSFRALALSGQVITTPFTSPATINAIVACGLTPVFADIDSRDLTLDPAAVERAISSHTSAIVGVHIFGMPCRTDSLRTIADQHGLRLIYDGAHSFGSEVDGKPITRFGDLTTLSFHATKLFNTAEGGAIVTDDADLKRKLDLWKTLGMQDEVSVVLPGINGRMNELEAALGLANLDLVDAERDARSAIGLIYSTRLAGIEGLTCFETPSNVRRSHTYFVVRVDNRQQTASRRDYLYERLKAFNVFVRRYFYPLCSNFPIYRDLPSAAPQNLPAANRAAKEVLCLPFFGALGPARAHQICAIVRHILA